MKPVPYAAGYFAKRGIAQLNIFAHWNHWFQVEDMAKAIDAVSAQTEKAAQRIVYGSSMGAFGALQFAARLHADMVIAFAPQYSMNLKKAPFENRHAGDMRAIAAYRGGVRPEAAGADACFINDSLNDVTLPERTYIIYDPQDAHDAEHVRLIAEHHRIMPIYVYRRSHWPDKALRQAGLLSKVIDGIISGDIDPRVSFDCPFD